MNYKDRKNSDKLEKFKGKSIASLDKCISDYISSTSDSDYKKAALITYWIRDFCQYIKWEDNFNPKKLKRYERGDIIKVNLGFNVGNEEGGLHYAVVINNSNPLSSGVITIIPLSSVKKGESIYPDDIDLGNELYTKVKIKLDAKLTDLNEKIIEMEALEKVLKGIKKDVDEPEEVKTQVKKSREKIRESYNVLNEYKKIANEISHMKYGSKAIVSQITTVSKLRIFDPRSTRGVLSGIKLSPENLDLISNKISEMYLKTK